MNSLDSTLGKRELTAIELPVDNGGRNGGGNFIIENI